MGGCARSGGMTATCGEKLLRVPYKGRLVEQGLTVSGKLSLALVLALCVDPPAELALIKWDARVAVADTEGAKAGVLVKPVSLCGVPDKVESIKLFDAVLRELVTAAVGTHLGDPHTKGGV